MIKFLVKNVQIYCIGFPHNRVKTIIPDVKIILQLRHPVLRLSPNTEMKFTKVESGYHSKKLLSKKNIGQAGLTMLNTTLVTSGEVCILRH